MKQILLDNIYIVMGIILALLLIIIVITTDIIKSKSRNKKRDSLKRQIDPKEKIGFNINPTELKMYSKVEDKSKNPDDLQKTNTYTLNKKNK